MSLSLAVELSSPQPLPLKNRINAKLSIASIGMIWTLTNPVIMKRTAVDTRDPVDIVCLGELVVGIS